MRFPFSVTYGYPLSKVLSKDVPPSFSMKGRIEVLLKGNISIGIDLEKVETNFVKSATIIVFFCRVIDNLFTQ